MGQPQNKLQQCLRKHWLVISQENKTAELFVHFRGHDMENLLIAGLESRTGSSTAQRFAAERHWITNLKNHVSNALYEVE